MKKIFAILMALTLMLSVMPMSLSTSAEGNVITAGDSGDYETLADAVTAAIEGDTVQLVSDVIAKNVSLNKSITIDTNGYTWTGGEGNGPGSNKANCGTVSSGVTVTIINSQRTEPITSEVTKFDVQANSANRQGSIVLSNNSNLVLKNVAVQSTNGFTNNQPCAVYFNSAKTATLTMDNCYLTSDNWGAIGANYTNSLMQITAKNSIFNGAKCSVFYAGTPSSTPTAKSEMSFEKCTFVKPITAMASNADTSIDTATASYETVTYNFKNCTAPSLFAPSATAVFGGSCAFETVKSGVVVSADESTGLYSDDTYETELTAGVLTTDTPVYTKLLSLSTSPVTMKSGASIRLNEQNGIRFYTTVDTDKLAEFEAVEGNVVEFGTLIAPADLVTGELTHEIGADNYVDVPYKADIYFEDTTFVGSIVGIKPGNIGRKFIGRGYIKVTNGEVVTYYYATQNDNERSLKSVATLYKGTDEYNSNTDEVKELVNGWASAADWSAQ